MAANKTLGALTIQPKIKLREKQIDIIDCFHLLPTRKFFSLFYRKLVKACLERHSHSTDNHYCGIIIL